MLECDQEEVFYKNIHQSTASNFHDVIFPTRNIILLVLTLDGTLCCFYLKDDEIFSNFFNINSTLQLEGSANVDVINSSVLAKSEGSQFLLVGALVNGECKLLLYEIFDDVLNPICYKQCLDLDYHPCFVKVLKYINNDSFFVISGANESLYGYRIENNSLCQFFLGETLTPLCKKVEAVVICMDLMIMKDLNCYWFGIGCDSGLILVWQVSVSTNTINIEMERKFDTPVSLLNFVCHDSSCDTGPALLMSSALGPVLMCLNLNEGNLTESIKFNKSDKFDVVITDYIFPAPETTTPIIPVAFGTFGYKLLFYSVNMTEKSAVLKVVRDYLAPVIGIKKFVNFCVVLTCTGIYFYKV